MNLKNISKQDFMLKMETLNINAGDIVYIETQLSPDFFNPNLANGFIRRLLEYLGEEGTIVMSLAGYNFDVDYENFDDEYILPYVEANRSQYAYSRLANLISSFSGAKISKSSFFPFVAYGKYAELIVSKQSFDFPNGNQSPFSRMYELRAKALLIEHNVKDFLLNEHCVERSYNSTIYIDSGIVDQDLRKYMRKRKRDLTERLFESKKYKELFYYTGYKQMSVLSVSVREYVDFGIQLIER